MQAAEVTIYVTDYCGYCTMAKRLLSQKQVRFTQINVEDRDDLRAWLVKASGQRTVPQIFINGNSIGGFSELSALEKQGELDTRLAEAPRADAPTLPR
ncbi:glutaredoxin 3 [Sorangium sp. So ce1335]|uniref:glutaredoxin 3 n=1 Tax=Sorangium sp. So ce1335 TaxID=3133335 RepID=UPI003F629462